MNETMWAVLLRPVLGPVILFVLFGAAWLGATLLWKAMPASKLRASLFRPMEGTRAGVILALAILAIAVGTAIYSS